MRETTVRGKFTIDIEDFADSLASEGADQQGLFFDIFFKALAVNCETPYKFDMQLSYLIGEVKSPYAIKAIKFLQFEEE